MTEFTLGYREVISDQDLFEKWTEITLTTGGTQSTLQDIKATEKANGYSYEDSAKVYTRNRFIYWRIIGDCLELIEHSLDVNLTGNKLKIRFTDSPIIDGLSVRETEENVLILVPTVCSVHRLIFPHPAKFHTQDDLLGIHPNLAAPSIFSKVKASDFRNTNSFYVFNSPNSAIDQLPNLASSFYNADAEEAIFTLAYPSSELLLIKLSKEGKSTCQELKGESLMPRFLSGLTEKFRAKQSNDNQIISTLIDTIDYEIYILTLTRNGHLKFWSGRNEQCFAVVDVLAEIGLYGSDKLQSAALRKSMEQRDKDNRFAIFLKFSDTCQFHIIRTILSPQQIQVKILNTLTSAESDLIDFALQFNRIWAAWRINDDDCVIYSASFQSRVWTPIVKEVVHDTEVPRNSAECDPRQFYLQHLFHPGRFPLHIINKALGIYRKSNLMGTEINLTSVAALKQAICLAIESDTQSCFSEGDVVDHEFLEYSEWCWQKFYSCCIQYHRASLRPLGFMLLPQNSGAILLKKGTFSFLRPMEPLEHMALCSNFFYKSQFINFDVLEYEDGANSGQVLDDLLILFEALVYMENQLSAQFKATFEAELSINLNPERVITQLLETLKTEMEHEFNTLCEHLFSQLNQTADLYKVIHKLLELLRHDSTASNPNNEINPNAQRYFSSTLGVSFVASCLRQQCQNRFSICRNLLTMCEILVKGDTLQTNVSEAIYSVCKPEIIYLTQAYFVMLWLTKLPALNNVPQESTLQRLTPIKLTPAFNVRPQGTVFSLLEVFTSSTGGQEARKLLAKIEYNERAMAHWHLSLLPFVSSLRYTLWPLKTSTVLPEWLVSSGQHVWLQQYVKLLGTWCDWNISSCNFLLAVSFLTSAENYKALDLFEIAAKGILHEPFLQKLIKGETGNQAYIAYYLKVIQLFELHKSRDCSIQTAKTALSIIDADNPRVATLYSVQFKHHLALRHYKEAFYALKANPDNERKKDNLRDLVKTLLDERNFDMLLSFTYGDMDELFTSILLTRARATDAANNIFYDFLYAYQVKRGPLCHRLAASVMYEQAYRLSQCESADSLEKQVKCYLAAKNVLQLVDPQYAWVIRPADPDEEPNEVTLECLAGLQKDSEMFRIKKQVEVVTVDTIKKALTFACAKLQLERTQPTLATHITAPEDLVTLLNSVGHFKSALEICSTFNLPYGSVFEALTWRCVSLSEDPHNDAWSWLLENDLQDLSADRENVASIVWDLLKTYLRKYEEPHSTVLHKVVCEKIISLRMYVPFWLLASYKMRNPGELIKILHRAGRLEEAIEVCHEYLLAALGYGKELYGFKASLAPNAPLFCVPVYPIQALITELRLQNEADFSRPFEKEYEVLNRLFPQYLTVAVRISNEKCQWTMVPFSSIPSYSSRAAM
ncbi:hypothetical protein HUJ04_006346 [Dendroctonus ponderosae]|uniref:Nuclear pore complex protein Nup160 homolog n=1 Tax=Dendroctonus ponderosae TaxID=77166 RepID=A0AAR5PMY4_DENPD|nr:hypothetical protein HUJ04_006346 [Dendroctonus ponderosae]